MNWGITGGIGSGKSLACSIFEHLGIPVYTADERAKSLYVDEEVRKAVVRRFGHSVYTADGALDRKAMAAAVFGNPSALAALNAIIHPAVERNYRQWLSENAQAPYTLKEAAILIETGGYKRLDGLICVEAPEQVRIQRTKKRDHVSEEEVMQRMKRQLTDAERRKHADFLIQNDGKTHLIPQVLHIHRAILQKCNQAI